MVVDLVLDTLSYTAVDVDVRDTCDFTFFKSVGMHGLPKSLYWVFRYLDPNALQNLRPEEFVVLSRQGSLGVGTFPEIPWHKQEREYILGQVGIKVEFGEELDYGVDRGTFTTLGDREHAAIIDRRAEGLSIGKLAEEFSRSSATVLNHINRQNKAVARLGFCEQCRKVDGASQEMKV